MNLILSILLSSVAIYFTAWLLPGISVKGYGTAIWVAIILGLLNTFVKPILNFLTFPINFLTLGLFHFVINAVIILLVGEIVKNFHVKNFGWGLLFSIITSIVLSVLEWVIL